MLKPRGAGEAKNRRRSKTPSVHGCLQAMAHGLEDGVGETDLLLGFATAIAAVEVVEMARERGREKKWAM